MELKGVLAPLMAAGLALLALPAAAESLLQKLQGNVRAAVVEAEAAAARIGPAPVAAIDFAGMQFAPAGIQETVELTGQSPVFVFPEGKTRYAAFAIPELRPGSQLAMTQVDGSLSTRGWRATVRPILLLLDADFREIDRWIPDAFPYDHGGMKHYGHKAVRRVEAHMAKAKYAVLLADPRAVGQVHAVKFQSSQMMLFPSENHFELPFSHEGVVLLNFRAQVGFQQRRAMGR
jgi:hypothetical protein